ncbi:tyrosine-type recombinase/integrase [Neomoorella glycerini]|nr:tyrosine-type recombinase/integrase [Moorella glycerini]
MSNPLEEIKMSAPGPAKRDTLTQEKFKKIIASTSDCGFPQLAQVIVTTLYGTGIRVSELINLPYIENPNNLEALLIPSIKTKKEYLLPLLPWVVNSITEYIKGERSRIPADPDAASFLFLTPKGKKLSKSWINKLLKSLCIEAGIQKNITAHCMRHSFATNLWKNGANLVEIKELLNHASINTTMNYVHLLPRSNQRKMIDEGPLAEIVASFWRNKSL